MEKQNHLSFIFYKHGNTYGEKLMLERCDTCQVLCICKQIGDKNEIRVKISELCFKGRNVKLTIVTGGQSSKLMAADCELLSIELSQYVLIGLALYH